jgi:diguanylate cyclase (GGDEF)-like protein/PAS domain S-box-containing protein
MLSARPGTTVDQGREAQSLTSSIMQALDQLSREELIALAHDLQARLAALVDAGTAAAGDLDYVSLQALTVLDNSGIAALVFDTAGTLPILAANACLCALAGYARDEVDRLSVVELLAPEDRDRLRRMLRLPRQGGFASAGGWRLCARSGEVREIEVSGYDLDFRGRRARFAIVQDVTQRRREQLVHERLAAIVETSRDAILSHTVDGIVLSWNRAAQRLFGYGAAELVGRSIDALLPDDIRTEERELLRGRIAAGMPIENYHTQRQHKDGTHVDVALSVSPLRDTEGRIVGAASIIRDMRATREAQRQLSESYQRLKFALESAALSLWDWDIAAREVTYSEEFVQMLGFSAGELPQDSYLCEHLAHGADGAALREALDQHLSGARERFECEFRVRRRDGSWCWLSARGQLVARNRDGQPLRMTGTAQDVSQRRGGAALDQRLASEARFRSLVEASAQAVWITNARGEVESEIPSWQSYTGLAFEQVRGNGWLQAIHPDDRALTAQRWRQACDSGTIYDSEFRLRRQDGVWRHMHAHGVPVRNDDGSIREWVGMNSDVTERKEAEAARGLLAAVADSSHDAIISHDMEGTILSWNRGAEEIFGYRQEEVIGRDYRLLTPNAAHEQTRALAQRLLGGERIAPFEVVSRHRDGHEIPVSMSLAALRNEAGRMVGVTAVARDITESRRAAQALRESEQQLESILNNAAEAVIVVSADGSIERFNLAAQRLFGYGVEETRGLNLRQLTVELACDETAGSDERSTTWLQPLMGGRREVTGRRKDGSIFPLELALSEIGMAPRPPRFTAVVRDITERKSWENRIYTLAYTDSLTGLPNRLLLRDRLEHAIAAAQRNRTLVGVLFFDLDHFKAINDSYGHHMGDELLREIAARTTGCVREIDTVSRLGGDEFVLVLPELRDSADAGAVARKLMAALSQPYHIDGHDLSITPTLGISIYPKDGTDADMLLRNADTAMYHAKESGKNDFRFYG